MILIYVQPLFADDVYNFYFQKEGAAKTQKEIIEVPVAPEETIVEPVQALPKKKAKSTTPVEGTVVEETVTKTVTKTVEKSAPTKREPYKREWSLRLSSGNLEGETTSFNFPGDDDFNDFSWMGTHTAQSSSIGIGVTRSFNRYFDINVELLHLDNSSFGNEQIRWAIGLGATPIHINIFGRESIRLGLIGGVTGGDESSAVVYWGPRLEIPLSRKLNINSEVKYFDIEGFSITQASLGLTYDF